MSFKDAVKKATAGGKMSKDEASAAIAEASRNASPEAKAKNPNLKKVKGSSKGGGFKKAVSNAKKKCNGKKC